MDSCGGYLVDDDADLIVAAAHELALQDGGKLIALSKLMAT